MKPSPFCETSSHSVNDYSSQAAARFMATFTILHLICNHILFRTFMVSLPKCHKPPTKNYTKGLMFSRWWNSICSKKAIYDCWLICQTVPPIFALVRLLETWRHWSLANRTEANPAILIRLNHMESRCYQSGDETFYWFPWICDSTFAHRTVVQITMR